MIKTTRESQHVDIYLFTNQTELLLSSGGPLNRSHGPWLSLLRPLRLSLLVGTQGPLGHVTHAALGGRGPFL